MPRVDTHFQRFHNHFHIPDQSSEPLPQESFQGICHVDTHFQRFHKHFHIPDQQANPCRKNHFKEYAT